MAQKTRNPGAGRRQGFAIEVVSDANLYSDHSPLALIRQAPHHQDAPAVRRLVARFGLAPSTASAVTLANGWGAQ